MQTKTAADKLVSGQTRLYSLVTRLDAGCRHWAKTLDDLKFIYALYGSLDGLSLSYSTVKYCFDICQSDRHFSSSREMHNWLATPEGMLVAATETLTLVSFSFFANVYGDNDKNAFKRYVAIAWPYCRDALKGLKNAYKGIRSTLQAIGILSGYDLYFMIIPIGLLLGVLSMINRLFMRKYIKEPRIQMMKANAQLLADIKATPLYLKTTFLEDELGEKSIYKNSYIVVGQKLHYIDSEGKDEDVIIDDWTLFSKNMMSLESSRVSKEIQAGKIESVIFLSDEQARDLITKNGGYCPPSAGLSEAASGRYRAQMQGQSNRLKSLGFFSAAYGGVVDGLYLYVGVLGLAFLSSPVFIAMAICSAIFFIACIFVRLYEEYDYQQRLEGTKAKIELALCAKKLEAIWGDLERLTNRFQLAELHTVIPVVSIYPSLDLKLNDGEQLIDLTLAKLGSALSEFDLRRHDFLSLVNLSDQAVILSGLRNGLAAYSAITSLMFAIATVDALFLIPFSSYLLVGSVVLGLVSLIGFAIHSYASYSSYKCVMRQKEQDNPVKLLVENLQRMPKEPRDISATKVKEAVFSCLVVDPSPQFFFQEWFEVCRSFGSGLSKGPRLADFLQSMSLGMARFKEQHDMPVMLQVSVLSGLIQSIVFSLRALARGFGRDAPDVIRAKKLLTSAESLSIDKTIDSNHSLLENTEGRINLDSSLVKKIHQPGFFDKPSIIIGESRFMDLRLETSLRLV